MKSASGNSLRNAWRGLRPALTENLALKLFSFACALVLYAFVHGAQDAQRTVAINLVALMPPDTDNRALITPLPTTVRVTVHGPRSLVDDLGPDEVGSFQLDLRPGRSGRIPLLASMLQVPAGVSVDIIDPSALDIVWDDVIEQEVPILVSPSGEVAAGHVVKGLPEANPPRIRARGPKQIVAALQSARAEAFDVTGLTEGSHSRILAIEHPPSRVSYSATTTKVTVVVNRKLVEKIFLKVQVFVIGSTRATVHPAKVDVRVVGPPELVSALRPEQIVPRVDLKDAGADLAVPNSLALPVVFDLEGCEAHITPKTVIVKW